MKTLKNHLILFDSECPMCRAYTQAFVASGMLGTNGRAAYQTDMEACPYVDRQRAVNEIALVNLENGEVSYGVSSLFKIIGNSCPAMGPLFACKPFGWLMSKVYAFISYNRRVIIPGGENEGAYTYQPSFKLHYRIAWLLFTWLCTGYLLTGYVPLLSAYITTGGPWREYLICGGQIIFQGVVICTFARKKVWDYLGNMMTISFGGSLLLLAAMELNRLFTLPPAFFALYFAVVVGMMFLEHMRRCKLLGLGWMMTATWVIYRVALLGVIYLS